MLKGWYYKNPNSQEIGPITALDLKQLAQKGVIQGETLVKMGDGNWVKALSMPGLPLSMSKPVPKIEAVPPPLSIPTDRHEEEDEEENEEYQKPKKTKKNKSSKKNTKKAFFGWQKGLVAAGLVLLIATSGIIAWLAFSGQEKWMEYYNKGQEATDKKQHGIAIQHYTDAIKHNKKYLDAYLVRGDSYIETKEYDKAIVDFTMAIELNSTDYKGYYRRAKAYTIQKEP